MLEPAVRPTTSWLGRRCALDYVAVLVGYNGLYRGRADVETGRYRGRPSELDWDAPVMLGQYCKGALPIGPSSAARHRALVTAPMRGPGLDKLAQLAEVVHEPWTDQDPLRHLRRRRAWPNGLRPRTRTSQW